jgi:hypothetical protein
MPDGDYSHVPLWHKLGAKAGTVVRLLHVPAAVDALQQTPPSVAPGRKDVDVILTFATRSAVLEREFVQLMPALAERGGLWVAWPKKTSSIPNDLSFDTVQRQGLSHGLVDNKTCRIDDDWQAVRFVRRLTK